MSVTLVPPGPAANVNQVLQSLYDAVSQLQQPDHPSAVCAVTQAKLPPASDWPQCVVLVSDLGVLAASNGSAWIRQDTGASI